MNEILVELSKLPFVRVWKNQVGVFRDYKTYERVIKVGVVGAADINGILLNKNGVGVRLEIEVKTGSGVQTPEQKNYERMINAFGGLYYLARDVAGTIEFCKRAANRS